MTNEQRTMQVPQDVLDILKRLRRPVVISHVVPDADALGSMFALVRAMGSDACVPKASLPGGSVSKRLTFLLDMAGVDIATPEDFAAADGFIALDTAKKPRCNVGPELKQQDWSGGRPVLNVDHHTTNTMFGDVNWVAGDAGSTCEILHFMLAAAGLPVDATSASLLFSGILTDTVGFSLPTTSAATFRAAAELTALGADVGTLGERLNRSQSKAEFDLLRIIYANTELYADGQVACSHADHAEIHGAGCTAADIDEQINVPRSLNGVRLAMLFTEGNPGKTRINFRGSGSVEVLELAGEFGGGGHLQAAGAVMNCPVSEAIQRVVPRAIEYLKKFPDS